MIKCSAGKCEVLIVACIAVYWAVAMLLPHTAWMTDEQALHQHRTTTTALKNNNNHKRPLPMPQHRQTSLSGQQQPQPQSNNNVLISHHRGNKNNKQHKHRHPKIAKITESGNNNSDQASKQQQQRQPVWVLAGMVQHTNEIRDSTWNLLKALSCQHNVAIHIIAQTIDNAKNNQPGLEHYQPMFCAPFFMEFQDRFTKDPKRLNEQPRLHRIPMIRDAQRHRIQRLFFSDIDDRNEKQQQEEEDPDRVIVLDLDLLQFPNATQIVHRMQNMFDMHVVCAAGNWWDHPDKNKNSPNDDKHLFYYDIFAFVAWPDTFGFPPYERWIPHYYAGEDPSIVPFPVLLNRLGSPLGYPVFTQFDLMDYLHQRAAHDTTRNTELATVRSCFGGLAIYRASTWLTPQCQYNLQGMLSEAGRARGLVPPVVEVPPLVDWGKTVVGKGRKRRNYTEVSQNILRYASGSEKWVCEHVVFHDCLHRVVFEKQEVHEQLILLEQQQQKQQEQLSRRDDENEGNGREEESVDDDDEENDYDVLNEEDYPHKPHVAVDPNLVTHWRTNEDVHWEKQWQPVARTMAMLRRALMAPFTTTEKGLPVAPPTQEPIEPFLKGSFSNHGADENPHQ